MLNYSDFLTIDWNSSIFKPFKPKTLEYTKNFFIKSINSNNNNITNPNYYLLIKFRYISTYDINKIIF